MIKTYRSKKTIIKTSTKGGKGLFANENIQVCKELCLDYAMVIPSEYKLNCNCGNSNCRKVITGDDRKTEELQIRYDKYFPGSLQKNSQFILKK